MLKYSNYETNTIEFKETLDKTKRISWLKKVCAMANEVSGGKIVVGVNDENEIIGVENIDDIINLFTVEVRKCIEPTVTFTIEIKKSGIKEIIIFTVIQGNQPPYILKENNGRHIVYVMRGNTTEPAVQNDFIQLALRATNLSWDTLNSNYSTNQITFDTFNNKHKELFNKYLNEKDLEELGLINKGNVTNVGLLFSDQNPNSDSWISMTRWPGLNKAASQGIIDKEIKGCVVSQIEEAYNFVASTIRQEFSFSDDSPQRKNSNEYDLQAVREVIINAIAHRDYSIHNNQQIEVGIYDDRIEIKSTGSLLNGHTIDDLIKLKTIGRRNKTLCNILRELDFIESRGRGIGKIIDPKEAWKRVPNFVNSYNFFMVTLYSRYYKESAYRLNNYLISLDYLDIEILNRLKNNSTITQRELSAKLNISHRTLTNRFNKLYKERF